LSDLGILFCRRQSQDNIFTTVGEKDDEAGLCVKLLQNVVVITKQAHREHKWREQLHQLIITDPHDGNTGILL
jgi:hypothetical protein